MGISGFTNCLHRLRLSKQSLCPLDVEATHPSDSNSLGTRMKVPLEPLFWEAGVRPWFLRPRLIALRLRGRMRRGSWGKTMLEQVQSSGLSETCIKMNVTGSSSWPCLYPFSSLLRHQRSKLLSAHSTCFSVKNCTTRRGLFHASINQLLCTVLTLLEAHTMWAWSSSRPRLIRQCSKLPLISNPESLCCCSHNL